MKRIETFQTLEDGYWLCVQTPKWQVAVLNFSEEQSIEIVNKVEVHHNTDEVFLLKNGMAALIAVDIEEGKAHNWQCVAMQNGVVYNVLRDVWHTIVMSEDTTVFITENSGTHKHDVAYYSLSLEEQATLRQLATNTLGL